jgi:hypothetical protein
VVPPLSLFRFQVDSANYGTEYALDAKISSLTVRVHTKPMIVINAAPTAGKANVQPGDLLLLVLVVRTGTRRHAKSLPEVGAALRQSD